jgi:ribonucleotide reductase beta subunit family protein with ferritin-like domain
LSIFKRTPYRADVNEKKKIRDQAYTYLKKAVDDIYAYGQYVFRHNENRLKGYGSHYIRGKRALKKGLFELKFIIF